MNRAPPHFQARAHDITTLMPSLFGEFQGYGGLASNKQQTIMVMTMSSYVVSDI